MKLSIITLTYNNLHYTKKYIESLYKNTKDFELILVDNGSTDGTVDYIKSLPYNNIKLIINEENLGYAKGNNQGIAVAEGEYIGFLNNDILLPSNWFDEIEKVFIAEEKAGFVSPIELNPKIQNVNEHNYQKYLRKFPKIYDYRKSYYGCIFSCVITKSTILNEIGNFDENITPAFFEDDDLMCRAIESGYDLYEADNCCYFHFGSITSSKHTEQRKKNENYFYSKHRFGEYVKATYFEYDEIHQIRKSFLYNIYLVYRKIKRIIVKYIIKKLKYKKGA